MFVAGFQTIGTLVGCLTAYFLKFTRDTRVIEPLVIFVMSYLAYILAETVHWSGIISLVTLLRGFVYLACD